MIKNDIIIILIIVVICRKILQSDRFSTALVHYSNFIH
ncbi:hypothetical protein P5673_023567 [Acropora cervicornis]|uniref:Uncharacterized protein n=1 Tax=Acropora cervicornis TaxID=6130 RepID=A0AAD9Q532_ACRCE|nr:hypothetical protein P5673_023567 [Acropora cervicornis]